MHEFSIADGFVDIYESIGEMIKNIANEPSLGLHYIQKHVQNIVPNAINLNTNILKKSRETVSHTEDLEDSITMIKSMKGFGSIVADEMMRDINNSLLIISTKQPKMGLLCSSEKAIDTENISYLSSVFKSAKQRARSIKWPQLEFKEGNFFHAEKVNMYVVSASSSSYDHRAAMEGDDEQLPMQSETEEDVSEMVEYNELKDVKEANLKTWLGDMDGNPDIRGYAVERI